jgi:hypothetical protein
MAGVRRQRDVTREGATAVSDQIPFLLPTGYRIVGADATASVECARGCGWTLRVATLAALPSDARNQLFQHHNAWHVTHTR